MNQTFNLHRFLLVMRLEFTERGRNNLIIAALLVVALLAMMLPVTMINGFRPFLTILPVLALFLVVLFGGSLYTTQLFTKYGPTNTGIPALMVPASQLEKFLAALVLHVVFATFLMGMYLLLQDWTTDYANSKIPEGSQKYGKLPQGVIEYFIGLYIITQGLTFLGSLYFAKSAYLKTLIVFTAVSAVLAALNLLIANHFTGYPLSLVSFPLSGWQIAGREYLNLKISESIMPFVYAVPVVTILCLFVITYFRLKEKEI